MAGLRVGFRVTLRIRVRIRDWFSFTLQIWVGIEGQDSD